jgi:hypothetical protein
LSEQEFVKAHHYGGIQHTESACWTGDSHQERNATPGAQSGEKVEDNLRRQSSGVQQGMVRQQRAADKQYNQQDWHEQSQKFMGDQFEAQPVLSRQQPGRQL